MANKLINSHSPYLIRHANDKVQWYTWSNEAFKRAKLENKPIFLSIGYSSCHWCHIMAKESFNDDEIANFLNKNYISIKVDKEERPDIDAVYMQFCHYITGSGGWPLTIIMTPDKTPFFAATYLPKKNRFGRPGLIHILHKIMDLWNKEATIAINLAEKIRDSICNIELTQQKTKNTSFNNVFTEAYKKFLESFDEEYGGFGLAPKFPMPSTLLFLLHYGWKTDNKKAVSMVLKTLDSMRQGGIYDHIGNGFHRYSVDRKWSIPHFEKMLIDQAYLIITYIEAYKLTKKSRYKNIAKEIISYSFRNLMGHSGEFYTSEDADSNDEEGAYYYWKKDELVTILSPKELEIALEFYNISDEGNFIDIHTNSKNGKNILWTNTDIERFAELKHLDITTFTAQFSSIQKKLFTYRNKRVKPNVDKKVLTDLNSLMIIALARAYRVFDDKKYLLAAVEAADFLLTKLWEKNTLYHSYYKGHKNIPGFLNDFSYLIWGLLELYQATFDNVYLEKAQQLTEQMISIFFDKENGGFYVNENTTELPLCQKEIYASSAPSGNAVAVKILLTLGKITGNTTYIDVAESTLSFYEPLIDKAPHAYTDILSSFSVSRSSPADILLVGDLFSLELQAMLKEINRIYFPDSFIVHIPLEKEKVWPNLNSILKQQKQIDNKPTAYICSNYACNTPTTDIKTIISFLKNSKVK